MRVELNKLLVREALIELSDLGVREGQKLLNFLLRIGKKIMKYLLFQIDFLINFEYTKSNISNHLLEKAAQFFGFDFDEAKEKIKQKIRRKKPSNRQNRREKPKISGAQLLQKITFRKKNENRKTQNYYEPLE